MGRNLCYPALLQEEAAKLVSATRKLSKGQGLVATTGQLGLHKGKKNYTTSNPAIHCFMEAKQGVLMSECNKNKGLAGKEATRGKSLPDLNYNVIEEKRG